MRAASDARPVSRILYGVAAADGHSSRPFIAERLKRPTRKFGAPSRHALEMACAISNSFPIWSCSVWGLPCLVHCCASGALLPHHFTLTATVEHLKLRRLAPALPSRPAQKRIGFRHSLQSEGSATACACFTLASGSSRTALTVRSPGRRRYIFCGTFRRATSAPRRNAPLKHPPGRYPAHCSAEFGLSSLWGAQPGVTRRPQPRQRPSGPTSAIHIIR